MLDVTALAPVPWALRLVRGVARAAAVVAAGAPRSTTEELARHGIGHRRGDHIRRVLDAGGVDLGRASATEGRLLARLLDLGVPRAAALALALPACTTLEDHRSIATLDVYVVETDVETAPGQHLVEARAACDEGDAVLGGGCAWGEPTSPHDWPLRPVLAAPEGGGFTCRGQFSGAGDTLKTLRASAVCAARGES